MNEFTPEQKAAILQRDGERCVMAGTNPHCSLRAQTVNHRLNRSTGGTNHLANGVSLCHACNGLIESDPDLAKVARDRGVKIRPYLDSLSTPYWSPFFGQWVTLDERGDLHLTGDTALEQEAI